MLDSVYHRTLKSLKNRIFSVKKARYFHLFTQRYKGRRYVNF